MLEGVVLHVEQLRFRQSLVGAHRRDVRLHGERVRRDVARDDGGPDVAAGAERAEAGEEHHARQGVEAAESVGQAGGMALEVGPVRRRVARDGFPQLRREARRLVVGWPLDPERERLRPDEVIGCERRREGQRAVLLAVDECEHLGRDERHHDDAAVRPIRVARRLREGAAQHGRHVAEARAR